MREDSRPIRWYQFSLRSVIVAIAFAAVALTLLVKDRSYRRMVDERVMYARLDQATMLFHTQMEAVEERLRLMKEPCVLNNCIRRDNNIDGYDGLQILESWDFGWQDEPDLDKLRQKVRECLEPIVWLGCCSGPRSAWEVTQKVNLFEGKKQGEIIVHATYRPFFGN